jgi:hypothetical protein
MSEHIDTISLYAADFAMIISIHNGMVLIKG